MKKPGLGVYRVPDLNPSAEVFPALNGNHN